MLNKLKIIWRELFLFIHYQRFNWRKKYFKIFQHNSRCLNIYQKTLLGTLSTTLWIFKWMNFIHLDEKCNSWMSFVTPFTPKKSQCSNTQTKFATCLSFITISNNLRVDFKTKWMFPLTIFIWCKKTKKHSYELSKFHDFFN